uniref:Uncharacterized protein n=1 Tax=Anguilla anguilla TaxID=7936 RepID=A0A0E9UAH7_ANGAN
MSVMDLIPHPYDCRIDDLSVLVFFLSPGLLHLFQLF